MLVCLLICMKIEAQLVLCTKSCACAVPTCSTQHVHTARSKVTQYCSVEWKWTMCCLAPPCCLQQGHLS